MGYLMELYGLDNKVVMTFRSTHGMSNLELYGPDNKGSLTSKNTHRMSHGFIWIRQHGSLTFKDTHGT